MGITHYLRVVLLARANYKNVMNRSNEGDKLNIEILDDQTQPVNLNMLASTSVN